jgi:hypothetical protein
MKSNSYAIITPSYWMDVERCRYLVESVRRWVAPGVRHYLVIARSDLALFRPMLGQGTELIVVEDIIPRWLFRLPGVRRFWFSLRTRPVKNWILQQIVKLSVPSAVGEDVLLYADSDMFFMAPFDPHTFERDGKVPLLLEHGQTGLIPHNDEWQAIGSKLLGLPVETVSDINYVGQLIWWRRENALATVRRVCEITGTEWQRAVAPLSGFSEYILYGLHSHRILGEASGHWPDAISRTLNYWETAPLSVQGLQEFKAQRTPNQHSAMVSAKSRTPVERIREVFG